MSTPSSHKKEIARRPRLSASLVAVFALALLMGTGPGLYLINPDPADPQARFTYGGVPVLYLWGLLWYGVQIVVILTAYYAIWSNDTD